MRYGMSYRGSKNSIAEWVVGHLPSAEVLVDLFAGGCAITHCAMLSGKYKRIICNDILGTSGVFVKALHGQIGIPNFVGREEFFAKRNDDPLIAMVYSFGQNMRSYLYSKEIEPYKHALYDMLTEDNESVRRLKYRTVISLLFEYCKGTARGKSIESLQSLECLQFVEELNKLAGHEGAGIEPYSLDYRDVPIASNALVYCDPPYKGTNGYGMGFDSDEFFDWARGRSNTNLVIISEYSAPEDFIVVGKKNKVVTSGRTKEGKLGYKDECLFVHKSRLAEYEGMMGGELFPKLEQLS